MKHCVALATPYGSAGIVVTELGVSGITLTKQTVRQMACQLRHLHPDSRYDPYLLDAFQRQWRDYFAGVPVRFRVRVDLSGLSAFQRQVLAACSEIGYGETATYGGLARRLGRPKAARAVGAALGRNPVPIVIPCHRVVASDGSLCGFSAEQGVYLKRQLLELEARSLAETGAR